MKENIQNQHRRPVRMQLVNKLIVHKLYSLEKLPPMKKVTSLKNKQVQLEMCQIFFTILKYGNGLVLASETMTLCFYKEVSKIWLLHKVLLQLDFGVRSREQNLTIMSLKESRKQEKLKKAQKLCQNQEAKESINLLIGSQTLQ